MSFPSRSSQPRPPSFPKRPAPIIKLNVMNVIICVGICAQRIKVLGSVGVLLFHSHNFHPSHNTFHIKSRIFV